MPLTVAELLDSLPQTGRLDWIGLRPARRAPLESTPEATVEEGTGLVGDHYHAGSGKRQVTLIQAEHLEAVAKLLDMTHIDPSVTRRNLVVSGINLLAFANRKFQVGEVVLEMTDACDPCSRMEENLGSGAYNAMRGHGGITARVVRPGVIRVGDPVTLWRGE